jgi:hypothetical protein
MQIEKDKILENRMRTLVRAWAKLAFAGRIDKNIFILNHSIATKVIRYYAQDIEVLKARYGIPDRVQAPKIAGLMANAITKFRPVVPIDGRQQDIENSDCNELLSIYYGICVCANFGENNYDYEAMTVLVSKPEFSDWFKRFIYLLRERNYTSEALVMVFETLCFMAFPENVNLATEKF